LGFNAESTALLKQHPFFTGVNFEQISVKGYDGIKKLVIKRLKEINLPEK
jgi:hypothetical protein